jgi:phage shock protein E
VKKILIYFIIVLVTGSFISCGNNLKNGSVRPDLLIDVRTPEEYTQGHIPGSKLIDVLNPSFVSEINKLDKEKGYMVYCKSGSRSANAAEIMMKNGFKKVYHMDGGFDDWQGPVEK